MAYSSWTFAGDFAEVPVRTREMQRSEVVGLLGELAMRSKVSLAPLAREHLEAAWSMDSTGAVAAGALCELADRDGDDLNMSRWAAAVERAPGAEPRALALAGTALANRPFRRGYSPSWPARGADANALRARRLLEAANDAHPGRAEWLVPYGLTFVEDSTGLPLGSAALMTAHDAAPKRADATGALAMLQARVGARANALALYQTLRPGFGDDDAAWKYWAGYCVARRTFDDAEKWFHAGRRAEAESLLVQLQRDVREVGVASMADRVLAWMRDSKPSAPAPQQLMPGRVVRARAPSGGGGHPEAGDRSTSGAVAREGAEWGGDGATASDDAAAAAPPAGAGASTGSLRDPAAKNAAAPTVGDPRIARALSAARRGDFSTAEELLEQASRGLKGRERARVDTLGAEVRNQRRMRSALGLVQAGQYEAACALYEQVLADLPKPDVRTYARRQRDRYCRGGAVH